MNTYDSRKDTEDHINQVREFLDRAQTSLAIRSVDHDKSRLDEPEKSVFDEYTPKLKNSTYGSEEYKQFLAGMKVALDHHYKYNPHHPEHYADGIRGMSLLDLVEMLCDWKAATMRHANGNLRTSIELNQHRFGYTDEMKSILTNTARELGLLED